MDLLFDLDGTLTDSAPGILRCFAHALARVGHPGIDVPPHLAVGPPLYRVFEALLPLSSTALIERAIVAYRERYEEIGILENSPYPGVRDALTTLRSRGHQMKVVTMKPEPYAARVLTHFELAEFFGGIHAPALADRRDDKGDLVASALLGRGSSDAVMIGDQPEDIRAAHATGIRSIAALWGFGAKEELLAANADASAADISDVVSVVANWAAVDPSHGASATRAWNVIETSRAKSRG
ncbi:MAG TPA: HAD hydrolase-like protein [Vicinamibacterales bacterium]|jgi:phosphoglycolate phosphatase